MLDPPPKVLRKAQQEGSSQVFQSSSLAESLTHQEPAHHQEGQKLAIQEAQTHLLQEQEMLLKTLIKKKDIASFKTIPPNILLLMFVQKRLRKC
jgi:hypothetical protein